MKSKPKIYISFILTVLLFSGCTEEIFEPSNENFQAKSFISNIKSFETNATYKNEIFPVDTLSENKPYVTVQSWVVKGKDILVSITVPNDASELYFGASNSSSEYMGLNFSEEYQTIPSGYYQLDLSTLKAVKAGTVGYNNYQVVLSSVEDIQVDEFDLVLGYKSADGYSNLTSTMLDVKSIAPYQENLKVGFQPLTGYTYSIEITTPSGKTVKYSSNGGSEVFDNPQVPDANLTYDSSLGFNWIDFSNPEFGSYSLTAKIEINISGSSQYIYIYLAVITEGKIEQVNLDADIQQTGQNTALGTVNLGFDYFTEYQYAITIDPIIALGYHRIPINNTHTTNIQIHPDNLPASESVLLELINNQQSSGTAVFIDNGNEKQSLIIHNSQSVVIKGKKNSVIENDILLRASYKGSVLAEQKFSVRTWPMNMRRTAGRDIGNGKIYFEYTWESESGSIDDLLNQALTVGEYVEYSGSGENITYEGEPCFRPNSPPYSGDFVKNPTIEDQLIAGSGFPDTHSPNSFMPFTTPYTSNVFIGKQYYRFHDPLLMNNATYINLLGPFYIRRNIYEDPSNSSIWKYRIEKDGVDAEIVLP